jgi:hypothetical protein
MLGPDLLALPGYDGFRGFFRGGGIWGCLMAGFGALPAGITGCLGSPGTLGSVRCPLGQRTTTLGISGFWNALVIWIRCVARWDNAPYVGNPWFLEWLMGPLVPLV